jgi:hypothetical protein
VIQYRSSSIKPPKPCTVRYDHDGSDDYFDCNDCRRPQLKLDAGFCREFRDELVRGLLLLTAQDANIDPLCFVQTVRGVRKFMLYGAMQACQFVAWHSGIHVMFDVVVD